MGEILSVSGCQAQLAYLGCAPFKGQVPEWSHGLAWKACVAAMSPRVRIPPCPPSPDPSSLGSGDGVSGGRQSLRKRSEGGFEFGKPSVTAAFSRCPAGHPNWIGRSGAQAIPPCPPSLKASQSLRFERPDPNRPVLSGGFQVWSACARRGRRSVA